MSRAYHDLLVKEVADADADNEDGFGLWTVNSSKSDRLSFKKLINMLFAFDCADNSGEPWNGAYIPDAHRVRTFDRTIDILEVEGNSPLHSRRKALANLFWIVDSGGWQLHIVTVNKYTKARAEIDHTQLCSAVLRWDAETLEEKVEVAA